MSQSLPFSLLLSVCCERIFEFNCVRVVDAAEEIDVRDRLPIIRTDALLDAKVDDQNPPILARRDDPPIV